MPYKFEQISDANKYFSLIFFLFFIRIFMLTFVCLFYRGRHAPNRITKPKNMPETTTSSPPAHAL
jgi:hypothetical protein